MPRRRRAFSRILPEHRLAGLSDTGYDPYTPPLRRDMFEHDQQWRGLKPELGKTIELVRAPAPWTIAFDFSKFDGSDLARLTMEIGLISSDMTSFQWMLTDIYEVGVWQEQGPKAARLTVNGEQVSAGKLLVISAPSGPWPTRLLYLHERSVTKPVRYMLIDEDKYPQS